MTYTRTFLLSAALATLAARADVVPTAPWGGVVDKTGSDCDIQWNLDTTGQWKDMSIFLMTGSNQNFIQVAQVATGIDGTTGDGKYTWTCPDVTINAPIYFYAFSNNGASVSTWTTRFTIASAAGNTVAAPESTQPDGSATPWGTGKIVGSSGSGGSSSSSGSSAASGSSAVSGTSRAPLSSSGSSASTSSPASSSSSSAASSTPTASAASSVASSTTDDADTTVITVTPPTSRMTTSRTPVSSGVAANAASSGTTSGNTGGAASSSHGSVAGLGLVLAVLAGLWVA